MNDTAVPDHLVQDFLLSAWSFWRSVGVAVQDELCEAMDLNLRSFVTLVTLRDGPAELRQPALLADQVGLPRYEMSRVLAALTRRGLVEREEAPHDARRVVVSITPCGRKVLEEAANLIAQVSRPAVGPLGAAELRAMTSQLHGLAGRCP